MRVSQFHIDYHIDCRTCTFQMLGLTSLILQCKVDLCICLFQAFSKLSKLQDKINIILTYLKFPSELTKYKLIIIDFENIIESNKNMDDMERIETSTIVRLITMTRWITTQQKKSWFRLHMIEKLECMISFYFF